MHIIRCRTQWHLYCDRTEMKRKIFVLINIDQTGSDHMTVSANGNIKFGIRNQCHIPLVVYYHFSAVIQWPFFGFRIVNGWWATDMMPRSMWQTRNGCYESVYTGLWFLLYGKHSRSQLTRMKVNTSFPQTLLNNRQLNATGGRFKHWLFNAAPLPLCHSSCMSLIIHFFRQLVCISIMGEPSPFGYLNTEWIHTSFLTVPCCSGSTRWFISTSVWFSLRSIDTNTTTIFWSTLNQLVYYTNFPFGLPIKRVRFFKFLKFNSNSNHCIFH